MTSSNPISWMRVRRKKMRGGGGTAERAAPRSHGLLVAEPDFLILIPHCVTASPIPTPFLTHLRIINSIASPASVCISGRRYCFPKMPFLQPCWLLPPRELKWVSSPPWAVVWNSSHEPPSCATPSIWMSHPSCSVHRLANYLYPGYEDNIHLTFAAEHLLLPVLWNTVRELLKSGLKIVLQGVLTSCWDAVWYLIVFKVLVRRNSSTSFSTLQVE